MKFRIVLAGLLIAGTVQASTNVSGNQFNGNGGPWTLPGSPYIVIGNVTVPSGQFLSIMPGVQVRFNANYSITVNGGLVAHGQEGDSVKFMRNPGSSAAWQWIRYSSGTISDSCILDYCIMEYGTDAVWADGASVTIRNSHISHFTDTAIKGNSYFSSWSGLTIDRCNIHNNARGATLDNSSSPAVGTLNISDTDINYHSSTGIVLNKSKLVMTNCNISNCGGSPGDAINASNNTSTGAIFISGGSLNDNPGSGFYGFSLGSSTLEGIEIANNGQDGITMISSGQMTASRLLIHNNYDNGLQLTNTSLHAHNLTISSNGHQGLPSVGSGIFASGQSVILTSAIVDRNVTYGLYMQSGSGFLSYDNFYLNPSGNVFGTSPGVGCLEEDPLYVSITPPENFNLQLGSPCIDTGYPGDPLDPDSTRTDMGALAFFQDGVEPIPPTQLPGDFRIASVYPNPFNPSLKIQVWAKTYTQASLQAWSVDGRLAAEVWQGRLHPGSNEMWWEAQGLASGYYLLRLQAGAFSQVVSCTLVK
jgi:hypothetical protein